MQVSELGLCDVKLISPRRYGDDRGWFEESFNQESYRQAGLPFHFVQDNQSFSHHAVLRGLHFQTRAPQGKLIRVLSGRIWDVAVDLRQASPSFGMWTAVELTPRNSAGALQVLWIPEGFAHGFLVLSDAAEVLYKVTQPYDPAHEHTIAWNDPSLAITWPLHLLHTSEPIVSAKDAAGFSLADAPRI